MPKSAITRRRLISRGTAVAATAAGVNTFNVSGAYAAGKLSIGFQDHFVPGSNDVVARICRQWAEKEKVDLTVDFISGANNKFVLTIAAQAQARAGHDILTYQGWAAADYARQLEPVDDVMDGLIKKNGAVARTADFLARAGGRWFAVPASLGSQCVPTCSRIDLMKQHAGIDMQAMYPAGGAPKADGWTWDAFLGAAEKCFKAGVPFGMPLGQTADAANWTGALFQSHRAQLVNSNGDIIVKSDAVKQVLEYAKRLVQWLPNDVFAWDDASNNRWLISGRGALITNPPSAWAVAVRDAPQIGSQLWTAGMPAGPNGRYMPYLPNFWGIWNFSKNKPAAKSLLTALCQPEAIAQMIEGSKGYDVPAFSNLTTLTTYGDIGPPKGTLYHYSNPHNHHILSIAAAPAPVKIAAQIFGQGLMPKMIARVTQGGESIDKCIDWAQRELQGFKRA
jgi:ABC-type glycerol-3-phosphate transport system substrate-binding protein